MFNQESSKILNKISNKDNSWSNLPLVSLEWDKKVGGLRRSIINSCATKNLAKNAVFMRKFANS